MPRRGKYIPRNNKKTCTRCKEEFYTKGRGQRDRRFCYDCEDFHINTIGKTLSAVVGNLINKGSREKLSIEDIYGIFPYDCVCPILKKTMLVGSRYAPTIDKINPNGEYTRDNIQILSMRANQMKTDATAEDIENFCKYYRRK